MNHVPQISEAEYKVMKVVWQYAPISTREVVSHLETATDWNPKTIQTLLLRLTRKGALTYEKNGRAFFYSPAVKEQDYLDNTSTSFLQRYYDGTLNSMVLNFLEQDRLSEEEIEELYKILENRSKKKGK